MVKREEMEAKAKAEAEAEAEGGGAANDTSASACAAMTEELDTERTYIMQKKMKAEACSPVGEISKSRRTAEE